MTGSQKLNVLTALGVAASILFVLAWFQNEYDQMAAGFGGMLVVLTGILAVVVHSALVERHKGDAS